MRIPQNIVAILALILFGCTNESGPEEMVKLYDSHEDKYFQKLLREEQIPFKVRDDGYIVYPIDYQAAQERIMKKVRYKFGAGCGFKVNSQQKLNQIRKELEKMNIEFWLAQKDDGKWFVRKEEHSEAARKILREVMGRG